MVFVNLLLTEYFVGANFVIDAKDRLEIYYCWNVLSDTEVLVLHTIDECGLLCSILRSEIT